MNIVALVALVLGVVVAVGGVVLYGPWSLPAILLGILLACAGGLWLCAVAVSKGLEDW